VAGRRPGQLLRLDLRSAGAFAAPIAKTWALSVSRLPAGARAASDSTVTAGISPAAEMSSGAPTGGAISTAAAIAVGQSSASTSATASGRCDGFVDG